jgi:hypothetical protein
MIRCVLALTLICTTVRAQSFAWGVNGHPVSQEGYWQVPLKTQLDLVHELGAGWYRCDISAAAFQASTARIDELVVESEKRGLKLLPVLVPGAELTDEKTSLPELQAAATEFARTIVSRYKGRITHWELANELDNFAIIRKGETTRGGKLWEWDGAPDGSSADDYHQDRYERARALIQGLQEGVKAADPAAVTLVDTAGWLHYGFIERLVKEDRVPFDILAWHWYSEMGDMTKVRGKFDLIRLLQGYGKPLWITEINRRDGSKSGADQAAADYLSATAKQLRSHSAIEAFFVYELLDEPYFGKEGESDYGLVKIIRETGGDWKISSKKPAFDALRSVIESKK